MLVELAQAAVAPSVAFVGAWVILRKCCDPAFVLFVLDRPNERSLHGAPVPRTGGVGIMGGLLAGVGAQAWGGHLSGVVGVAAVGAVFMSVLGLVDDRRGLPVGSRLAVQVLVAAACLVAMESRWAGGPSGLGPLGLLGMLVWLGWMTNLYNFMDGADGLAGGMATIGFGTLALSAGLAGCFDLAVLCASISLAALAFLGFNFPPARVFMGDGGSIPLGFLVAALGWAGSIQDAWPGWYAALVFAPFVVDASWTLVQRMLQGERFWLPHRDHHYQKMVRMGLGHRGTVLRWYGAMVIGGLIALLIRGAPTVWQLWVAVGWLGCLVGAGWWIDQRWAAHANAPHDLN